MSQFELKDNTLVLRVKKAPILIRFILFFFALISFLLPIVAIVFSILLGNRFHFGYLIGVCLFGLIGFYLLRMSLWNTYGEETIKFGNSKIDYEASYGWFKDGKEVINISKPNYSIKQIGYVDDNYGVLVLEENDQKIESVVKLPINQLEELIERMKIVESL